MASPLECLGARPWCKLQLTIVSGKCQMTGQQMLCPVSDSCPEKSLVTPRCQAQARYTVHVYMCTCSSVWRYFTAIGVDVPIPDPYVSRDAMVYANVTGRNSGQMSSLWLEQARSSPDVIKFTQHMKHFNIEGKFGARWEKQELKK